MLRCGYWKIKHFTQDDMEILETLVPFLTEVIYLMYPHLKEQKEEVYISERLSERSKKKRSTSAKDSRNAPKTLSKMSKRYNNGSKYLKRVPRHSTFLQIPYTLTVLQHSVNATIQNRLH